MRGIAFRRHQIQRHMRRRLKEDRNQHYDNLSCACWHDPRVMARFKEQPKHCSCYMCCNVRRGWDGMPTLPERRALQAFRVDWVDDVNSVPDADSGEFAWSK